MGNVNERHGYHGRGEEMTTSWAKARAAGEGKQKATSRCNNNSLEGVKIDMSSTKWGK